MVEPEGLLRILHLEDSADDSELVERALRKGGVDCEVRRVECRDQFIRDLREYRPHVVLSDHALPSFDSRAALALVRRDNPELPFILVSGTLGEEAATQALRGGVTDYILKERLSRLPAAVRRAILEARERVERSRAEAALRESEERYALALRGANDGVWDLDLRTGTLFLSDRWKSQLGLESADLGSSPGAWFALVHSTDLPNLRTALQEHVEGRTPHLETEYRILHRDGSWRWMLARGIAVRDAAGASIRVAGSQTDVTARKQAEAELLRSALYDPLTELPNRVLFENRLARAFRIAERRPGSLFAVLFLDIDRFKVVNDSLGHGPGDRLLQSIARVLESCLRPGDTAARFGGDEFGILLEEIGDPTRARRVAERILKSLETPVRVGGQDVVVSASIGIAFNSSRGASPEAILRDADAAMYRAKDQGRSRAAVFDEGMHAHALEALRLEADLRRALELGQLDLHYQPIVSMATGAAIGCEALLRWNHPERGLVEPSVFIPLAEESGLIVPIGEWVLETACARVLRWTERAGRPLDLAVNLSARQVRQPGIEGVVDRVLRATGLDPARLHLELTESLFMEDDPALRARVDAIRALGPGLSLDDFGTGFASLSRLKRLPCSTLKIDRSFVQGVDTDPGDAAIVSCAITLAHRLGLRVVAEGVETPSQRDALRREGCDAAQGFLFGRPVPGEEFPCAFLPSTG